MRSPAKPMLLPILLLGLGLLLGSPAGAQNTPPFSERVDVDIINVDAFVQDASGHAVEDLEAEDFEIFEDGKQVEISNFFQNPKTAAPGSPAEDPQASLAASSTPPSPTATPVPAEEGQRLNLVVYIDLYNLRPAHRTQVVKALGLFLEDRIHQGDRILMMTHQRNLQLIHPFTQDLKQVSEGLAKVAKMTTNGQVQDAERLRARKSLLETDYDPIEAIRLFAQQQRLETEVSMQALEATLRSLGGLPGRKALLYVSDGLEKQPGIDLYRLYQDLYSPRERPGLEALRNDLSEVFSRVATAANARQITLYTLQARGAGSLGSTSAERGGDLPIVAGESVANAERAASEQEPLIALAAETGGSAILNTANFAGALARLSNDWSSAYSLGFRASSKGDGRYHKIEVKLKRPGLKVRHRSGYVDNPVEQRVADRALSSLLLDVESNPLGVQVEFATEQDAGAKKFLVPLLVRIPLRELTLLPEGDQQKGKLRLYFAVQDPDGAISQVQEIPYPIEIPAAEMENVKDKEIGYAIKLALREGKPKISIGVWDEISGTESYLLRTLQVGKTGKKAAP